MTDTDSPVVLVVEDEPSVAEGYELWLQGDYDVRTAHNGSTALDQVDDEVDVVLLDRMMPEMGGEEVLEEIRDRDLDCRVAMVTAVEPDFDVIEMGFDAYVTKPPERADLLETVERLIDRAAVGEELREYHSLMARKGALEEQKLHEELEDEDAYRSLCERIDEQRNAVDETLGDMGSDTDFVGAVRELTDDVEPGGGDDGSRGAPDD